jgi:TRAP-type C4-dicarboxylate transport system permease small subunit
MSRIGGTVLRAIGGVRRAQGIAHRLMGFAAGWVFVACAFFITADVLGRNFLGVSSQSSVELTGYMLALGTTWALGHTLIERCHVRIDLLIRKLPSKPRFVLHLVSLSMLVLFAGFLAKGALNLVEESWLFRATDISLLRVPLVIPQGLWAFGLGMFFLLTATMLLEGVLLLAAGRGAAVEQQLQARTYDEEAAETLDALGAPETTDSAKHPP